MIHSQLPSTRYRLYLDESGDEKTGVRVAVGALLTHGDIPELEAKVAELLIHARQVFGSPGISELHGQEIMQGSDTWRHQKGREHRLRAALHIYEKALKTLNAANVGFFGQSTSREYFTKIRGSLTPDDMTTMKTTAFANIIVAVSKAVPDGAMVDVLIDRIESEPRTRRLLASLKEQLPAEVLANVNVDFVAVDSSEHAGIQAADLVAYIQHRHFHVAVTNDRAFKAAELLAEYVRPMVVHWRFSGLQCIVPKVRHKLRETQLIEYGPLEDRLLKEQPVSQFNHSHFIPAIDSDLSWRAISGREVNEDSITLPRQRFKTTGSHCRARNRCRRPAVPCI